LHAHGRFVAPESPTAPSNMHVKHRTAGRMEREQLNNFACGQGPAKNREKYKS